MESARIFTVRQSLDDETLQLLAQAKAGDFCFYQFSGGNQTETEMLEDTLSTLKDFPLCLIGVFRFPFRFEGRRRMAVAEGQYYRMRDVCDGMTYHTGDGMLGVLNEHTALQHAERVIEWLDGEPARVIENMLNVNGAMNIDPHDVAAFVRQSEGPIYIHAFAGDLDEPLKYILSVPYLPHDYAEGTMLLVNIGYSSDVDMSLFQQMNLRLTDLFHKADLFKLGTHYLEDADARFTVTILVSGLADPVPRPRDLPKFYASRLWFKRKLRSRARTGLPSAPTSGSGTAASS